MDTRNIPNVFRLLGILLLLSVACIMKGCEREHTPIGPENAHPQEVSLTMTKLPGSQAKALRYYIKAVGVTIGADQQVHEIGPTIGPIEMTESLTFPFSIPITLLVPPCLYRFTWGVTLNREPNREKSAVVNVCENRTIDLSILTFEAFQIYVNPIHAPDPVLGGTMIEVRCGTDQVSAPDSDRWPLTATLSEEGGYSVSGLFDAETVVSGKFADPFPPSSFEQQRVFMCSIKDGRSPSVTFKKTIQRIPPCHVQNENDSGADSLRQVLKDAPQNECETITFAPGVSTITLTSRGLTVPAMTVGIDGDVTISGNNSSPVFWVEDGADVTFKNLMITNGQALKGGGIDNDGGTVTIAKSCTVSANKASKYGGGIYNRNGGMVTVNGIVRNNKAEDSGGGIFNLDGAVTVNGTVRNNTANGSGGGIFNTYGTVDFGPENLIQGNTANGGPGSGGGIFNFTSGTISGAPRNYGSGNTPDNCSGPGCP